jgi:hypothetical protein
MQAEETVSDRIEARILRWFGHVMRILEEKWPAIIHTWISPARRKWGRRGWSWRDGVTEAMKKRGDEGRRRPGPDPLKKRIGKTAGSRISTYICRYIWMSFGLKGLIMKLPVYFW